MLQDDMISSTLVVVAKLKGMVESISRVSIVSPLAMGQIT